MTARPTYIIALMAAVFALVAYWSSEPRPPEFQGVIVRHASGWVCAHGEQIVCRRDGVVVSGEGLRGDRLR